MTSFNPMKLTPDDPRLTAYALGEMEGADHLAIEAAVAADPELQQAVAEICGTAEQLSSAFEAEPTPPTAPILIERYQREPATIRFPYWIAAGLVAASFAILTVLIRPPGAPETTTQPVQLVRMETGPARQPALPAREGDSPAAGPDELSSASTPETVPALSDPFDSPAKSVDLPAAEVVFANSSESLLANASKAARRPGVIPQPSESTPPTETLDAAQVLREPQLALPAPPRLDPANHQPDSLLNQNAEDASVFQIEFAVRTPAEEIAESGSGSLESRRLFTSDPDVASNLATVIEPRDDPNRENPRNPVFVYDRNRRNVNLRSMLRTTGAPAARPQEVTEVAPPQLSEPTTPREPTPEETFRTLIDETVRIAVGLDLPETTARAANRSVTFDVAAYHEVEDNTFLPARDFPLSTLPVDVDSASYATVRRFLASNERPPRGAVRIEELINYFDYDYAKSPPDSDETFTPAFEVANAPWNREHRLVRVAWHSRAPTPAQRPAANLVFLIDVSGSMDAPDKLPLIKTSLQSAVERLGPRDRIALVVFSPRARVALPSTPVSDRFAIERAIASLEVGSGGASRDGATLAYEIAAANLVPGGINRVVLTTDGAPDFGAMSGDELTELITNRLRAGIQLTLLGYGVGHAAPRSLDGFLPADLATLAYVNSPREAHGAMAGAALLGEEAVARAVRVQVEFNPARVQAYRLIGYENSRLPQAQSSAGTTVVADVGPGHTLTSLYEVVPVGVAWDPPASMTDRWIELERNRRSAPPVPDFGELLTVKLRFSTPGAVSAELVEKPLFDDRRSFSSASADFKFASAVAAFGMVLRDSPYRGSVSLDQIALWATQGIGDDRGGYRSEFVDLVSAAQSLRPFRTPPTG